MADIFFHLYIANEYHKILLIHFYWPFYVAIVLFVCLFVFLLPNKILRLVFEIFLNLEISILSKYISLLEEKFYITSIL